MSIAPLVDYLRGQSSQIGDLLAQRYREEIVEYRSLPEGFIDQDVAPTAANNLETMLQALTDDSADPDNNRFDVFRDSAVRRFHQGVPMQALLHAYRLWGHTVWEQVLKAPRATPEARLAAAGKIMQHVDVVSTVVAQAYLEESSGVIQDREILRRDLLEALIAGTAAQRIERLSGKFGLVADAKHAVVIMRHRRLGYAEPSSLRESLRTVRAHLHPDAGQSVLTGVRDEEIVAIYPVQARDHLDTLRQQANAMARESPDYHVGVSRSHLGLASIPTAYLEAQNAVQTAAAGNESRAYIYSDALLDRIVRECTLRNTLIEDTLTPLQQYDTEHDSNLVATLRAYIASAFNLTRASASLVVQPNTVRYRLHRIAELTGHDPFSAEDVILLSLGLRATDQDAGGETISGGATWYLDGPRK
ncbi:CdaR family transcriptional regulator [Mycolicibacterium sp. HK-90]|uniref:PucR family transcriptional regulator n=1 Tax=Mycolicibacterium sp. HK-90 TaxID=3056937 RepID=UPI0026584A91|nr:helix-turn-helix domain-containing protein [Mycolicibacterium sp. HK-90]WKG03977.1 helix-turn-helix domain-containing protein [Mycolicibacterium sp. HK-90]